MNKERKEEFHTFVAKCLFVFKHTRPDIHTATAALTIKVKNPNDNGWKKLIWLLKYYNGTESDKLINTVNNLHIIKWYVDVSFTVYPDFCSHKGGVMIFGNGIL